MGHYLALGDRSGNPCSCCNVIFCRSLVAGTEAYVSASDLSAPILGCFSSKRVPLDFMYRPPKISEHQDVHEEKMKPHPPGSPKQGFWSQIRIDASCPILLLLQRTGLSTLCQSKFFHEFLYGFSSIHRCRVQA